MDTVRRIALKSKSELDSMRTAGHIVAVALNEVFDALEPGITTAELDDIARRAITAEGAKPAFLGLYGFPAVACISLNAEIVHGIPSERVISDGDLVSVDCGAIVDGLYSDHARTAVAGKTEDAERQRLGRSLSRIARTRYPPSACRETVSVTYRMQLNDTFVTPISNWCANT